MNAVQTLSYILEINVKIESPRVTFYYLGHYIEILDNGNGKKDVYVNSNLAASPSYRDSSSVNEAVAKIISLIFG